MCNALRDPEANISRDEVPTGKSHLCPFYSIDLLTSYDFTEIDRLDVLNMDLWDRCADLDGDTTRSRAEGDS